MSFRASLKSLIRRDPAASLRERAAELKARIPAPKPLAGFQAEEPAEPAAAPDAAPDPRDADLLALRPLWEARAAAYTRAIEEQGTISDNAPTIEAPPPREPIAEWARLIPGWRQRTGIEEAEFATAEAMDDLCEIENRLSNMPATTLAGLRLKARVAQRNEEVSWPEGLEESLVRDILAIGEPEIEADADLLGFGRQFEVARAREIAACKACNAAQREADRHMPQRPACLIYRASDARLNVHQSWMMPEALDGREVHYQDVDRLRRIMPMMHEVLRPVRPGERENPDHPGQRHEIVPHPEAQARAEEIVLAWDAWRTELFRIQTKHVTPELEGAAEAAGEAAADLAEKVAALPALTAAGFRVKLRALSHYQRKALLAELPEEPDPDQILSHSLWRDVQDNAVANDDHPATVEEAASLDFAAYTFDTPTRDPNGWMKEFARHAIGMHVADRTLRMTKPELVAFIKKGGDRDAEVPVTMLAALESAQRTFEGWGKLLDVARTRYMVAGSSAVLSKDDGTIAETIEPEDRREGPQASEPSGEPSATFSFVSMIDFASASLDELQSLHDIADLVGGVAYATVWTARCKARGHGDNPNAAGKLMQWLGDALTDVETAANNEARRRRPADQGDRETRLEMLALPAIQNGDPGEIEGFARELLAHVEAERRGR